ncbi:MAG: hypothetical protein L6V93_08895 [Clostridiales bacterium]|nr:MAG: hypothetical protein L6V93_08895 [Clostridiales bacterium]
MEINAKKNEKIFFTKNSAAVRSILFITRLPSFTTLGSAPKSEFNSTSCDTCDATSLPDAIAILQSASLSARTSFTPSPVIATVLPFSLSAIISLRFFSGVTRPKNRVKAHRACEIRVALKFARVNVILRAVNTCAFFATSDTVLGLSPEITF